MYIEYHRNYLKLTIEGYDPRKSEMVQPIEIMNQINEI